MSNISHIEVGESIRDNMMEMSLEALTNRALPFLEDGFKPSQRKILYTMKTMGLQNKRAKSANIEGAVMKIHAHSGCLAADTKLFLLSGDVKTIEELTKNNKDEYVLAIDDSGKIVPALATDFRKTKDVTELFEIEFANGFKIKATGNHKFRLTNGEWVAAEDLHKGHILDFGKIKDFNADYLQIYGNKTNSINIHNLVDEFINKSKLPSNYNVHHIDHNSRNNLPSNITRLTCGEHAKIHGNYIKYGFGTKYSGWNREKEFEKSSKLISSYNKKHGLFKAKKILDKIIADGKVPTPEIYNEYYDKVENYRCKVSLSTLFKNKQYNVTNFDELMDAYNKGSIRIIYKSKKEKKEKRGQGFIGANKTKEHQNKCTKSFIFNSRLYIYLKMAERNDYNLKHMESTKVFKYCANTVPTIVNINKITCDSVPVYDFTVPTHENALISISDDNCLFACAHNSYNTMVRMARESEFLLTPYVDGKGSFGKVYSTDMQPAAPRYTEASLAPICKEMLDTLNKHPNNMVDNYDGTLKEPALLSLPYPNILANSQDGIGIGFACSFPSFNLKELCDACILMLNGNRDIKSVMRAPDFSTGAKLMIDDEELKNIYETGKGKILLRAKFINDEKNNILEIIEIPYTTTAEKIISDIQKQYYKNKLSEITDVTDEIGIDGFKVSIPYKKGTDVNKLIEKLYALTSAQSSFNANMTLVYNNTPQTMGVVDIIEKWIEHRKQWVQDEINFDINDKETQLSLLQGLEKILLDIDKAVAIVKNSKNDSEVISGLKKEFILDDTQAEFVANIKLRNFNQDYILNKTKDIKKLKAEIKELKSTDLTKKLIKDLEYIKNTYGIERKTELISDWHEIETHKVMAKIKEKKVAEIEQGNSVIFINNIAVKRLNETTTAKTPDDMLRFDLSNQDEILLFTNLGKVFKVKITKIKLNNSTSLLDLINIKSLDVGEHIVFATPLIPKNDLFIVFDNNKAARFGLNAYVTECGKYCFKKGFSTEASPLYFEMISEDKIIDIAGSRQIDTSKFNTKQSRMTKGVIIR